MQSKYYLIFVIQIILTCFVACKSADDYLNAGLRNAQSNQYRLAIDNFKMAYHKNPNLLRAYLAEGDCYNELKLYDSAILSFQQVIKIDRKNTISYYNIAGCKADQKKYDEAIDWYNRAFISKGYDPYDFTKRQTVLELSKEGILGETDAARYDVNLYSIFFDRAASYFKTGNIKKAYLDYKLCIENEYYVKDSYYMIAHCWLISGKKDKACDAFHKAVFYGDSLSAIELVKNNCN